MIIWFLVKNTVFDQTKYGKYMPIPKIKNNMLRDYWIITGPFTTLKKIFFQAKKDQTIRETSK